MLFRSPQNPKTPYELKTEFDLKFISLILVEKLLSLSKVEKLYISVSKDYTLLLLF